MTPPKKPKLFTIGLRCGRLANRTILFANFVALHAAWQKSLDSSELNKRF